MIACLEVHKQCPNMVDYVWLFEFDELAWSRCQLAGAISLWFVSHKFIAGMASMCKPASSDMISASVMLWRYSCSFLTSPSNRHQCMWSKKNAEHHLRLTLSPSNFQQSQRLGRIPVCSLLLTSQRDMLFVIGCVMNVTDETCKSQIARSVPLLWLILPSSLLSKVNLVFLLPNTCIAKQYESKSLTIHPQ